VVEGTLAGAKTMFDCPVDLQLFGPGDPEEQTRLMGRMRSDGLPIGIARERLKDRQREEKKRAQEAAKAARAQRMGQPSRKNLGASDSALQESATGRSAVTNASIGELIDLSTSFDPRDASRVVEEFGVHEEDLAKMPMADAPEGLKATLYPHQLQGLAWMLDKESPKLPARGSSDIVQLWKHERNAYKNIATNYSTTTPPQLASGGILADDMGLGKTVQVISLLLADSQPKTPQSSKATLIISPLGVMSNWRDQIAEHVEEDKALRVLIYHGSVKKEAKKLKDYDVVITTYGALASEFAQIDELNKKNKGNPLQRRTATQGLFSFRWRRVVLDEGHTIRSPHTKSSRAACHLEADSRWTLTGTPIVNSLKDLYSQVRFLGISGGLESFAVFNSVLIRPMKANNASANVVLQALMGTLCLRRRKNMGFVNLNLPPMTSRLVQIKFWPHEQKKYEMVMYALHPLSPFLATSQPAILTRFSI
jgi:SWI/SNF-related matrix-associated actin-dependent regulator of chromatin subfamily A3